MTRGELLSKMAHYPQFYREVWLACLEIRPGETRSYKWLAGRIGRPRAARAVALALKRNPFAPFVPCHRVIRSDGSVGGYSGPGGAAAKERLLRGEAKPPHAGKPCKKITPAAIISLQNKEPDHAEL